MGSAAGDWRPQGPPYRGTIWRADRPWRHLGVVSWTQSVCSIDLSPCSEGEAPRVASRDTERLKDFDRHRPFCWRILRTAMNRPPEITQIEALLGRTFTTLETIGPYSAFRTQIDEPRVTLTPAGSEFPLDRVIETVGDHCIWCHGLSYTVFVGFPDDVGPPSLYAIAAADPIRRMEVFDVGKHNDFTGDTPPRARRYKA